MVWQIGRVLPMPLRSFFMPQETWSRFWGFFGLVLGTSIFIANRVAHMDSTMARANRAICGDFRMTRYCPGDLSLQGDRPASGLSPSLYIQTAGFVFTRSTLCLQILHVFTRLGSVLRSLCLIFSDSLSTASAFPPHFQHQFWPVPGWYIHLICTPLAVHQLV